MNFNTKKIIALLLIVFTFATVLPLGVFASEEVDENPTISVVSAIGCVGKTAKVSIEISNNPGIVSAWLKIGYDSQNLTLINVEDGGILGEANHSNKDGSSPYTLTWENDTSEEIFTNNGTLATLTFDVSEYALEDKYNITVDSIEILDKTGDFVDFTVSNGSLDVYNYILGDVNGDAAVDTKDRMYLSRHMADWIGYEVINEDAADVNGDSTLNTKDRMYLSRHLAGWIGYEKLISKPIIRRMTVDLYDLDTMPTNYNGNFRYYDQNDRLTTVSVGKLSSENQIISPDVYINGVELSEVVNASDYDAASDLAKMSGTIKFSLLNTDNTVTDFDTIHIDATTPFVVDKVNTTSSIVTSKVRAGVSRIIFDESSGLYEANLYDADGNDMEWTDLEENDVLMVQYTKTLEGKSIWNAKLVDKKVTGIISGVSGRVGSATRKVLVGNTYYNVHMEAELETTIQAGDQGTLYLDDKNRVVYFEDIPSTDTEYGYVINVEPTIGAFATGAQVQMLTMDNTIEVFDFAKKVKITVDAVDVRQEPITYTGVEIVSSYFGTGTFVTDLYDMCDDVKLDYCALECVIEDYVVTYTVNSENQITTINLATDDRDVNEHTVHKFFTYNSRIDSLNNYDPDEKRFDEGVITEDTVIFYIPADPKEAEIVTLNILGEDDRLTGREVVVYNFDEEDETIGCILVKDPDYCSVVGGNIVNATFVLDVVSKVDDEGDEYYEVQGYKDNQPITYRVDTSTCSFYELEILIGELAIPQYAINGNVCGFCVAGSGQFGPDGDREIVMLGNLDSITRSGKLVIGGEEYAIKSSANVYVFNRMKANSGRDFYEIDAGANYLAFDSEHSAFDPEYKGIYFDDGEDEDEANLMVDVYVFYTKTDKVTDVVYYIR